MEKQMERWSAYSSQEETGMEQDMLQTTESCDSVEAELGYAPPGETESLGTSLGTEAPGTFDRPPGGMPVMPYEVLTRVGAETDENRVAGGEAMVHNMPPVIAPTLVFNTEGMEATQATQFYKSSRNLHAPHAEMDNVVPLIEHKHLVIRVYPNLVKSWRLTTGPVYGEVWFKRTDIADSYRQAVALNGSITGRRATTIDRGDATHTLNFRISDLYTRGMLLVYSRCRVLVSGQWKYTPWFGRIFTFISVPAVRIRAHGVHYQRNGIVKTAPPLSDFIATGVYLRKTYPMSRFDFLSYDVIHFSGDLTNTSGGGYGQGWNALWNQLRALYSASGQDANHYALMKKGIPTAYGGCGGGNVGASFVGDGSIMAQELGHGLGRAHAPGCGADGSDPSYPHYAHPASATIGEFGMDYATGVVYNPVNSNDFMGYCGNPWVSPYTYRNLINAINNQPSSAGIISAASGGHAENLRYQQEHLYLNFRVSCNGDVELQNGFSLVGPGGSTAGAATHHSVELRDDRGNVLWAKRLMLEEAHQNHDDSHTQYSEAIPMLEGAERLVFKCGHVDGPTMIDIPKKAPTVSIKPLKLHKNEAQSGTLKLDWSAPCDKGEQVTSIIRYTRDGGKTWCPVVVGLTEYEYVVDLDQLPGGENCRLQVLASTILRTAMAETVSFAVTRTSRQAMISAVPQNEEARKCGVVELVGCAYSPDGCAAEEKYRWNSSLDGDLGCGEYLIANDLSPGEHIISLTAPNGMGGTTRAEYTLQVLPRV